MLVERLWLLMEGGWGGSIRPKAKPEILRPWERREIDD